ncbi:efflux RND transporter permease subunit [Megalodesulfovibrio gigas]|uniref:Putative acriflavin resistance protein n=1 Tax=Megalodesulfovibrio gigas (strain ATCC 19364 / DSM 1382 / NCIMB 9332 / VKM B-1759) TaxID=1121448 RepID=T2G6T8_MEGG1|nr:efflux RND transporter permease subunit [Megalodesulfovibrio gigas]AGW12305.1 putative acriflavin resistance protein [Megalodesulfovibrio gigas DSM 1382 = ATCC 19364]
MNLCEPSIRRPVATTLVMAGLLLFGIMSYRILPVSDLPAVDFPTISVSASMPGADPETMASTVATPLERQFATISGIDSISSTSSQGSTRITLQFNLDRDIDAAAQDVQSAIAKAQRQLPDDMPSPPSYQKVNPADQPVFYISLASETLPMAQVDEYADTMIAQRLSMLPGVAQVSIYGSKKYAVRVQLDPKALASREVGIDEVAQAIGNANVNLPTGTLYGAHRAMNVQASGQLMNAPAYRPLIVAWRGGAPVRLQDLGEVIDSIENDKAITWRAGQTSIVLAVQRQPGANTMDVVDGIKALLPVFEAQMPAAISMEVLYDRSASIRESVEDVKFTLVLTVCLVVLVIFLFLRNIRATVIPSLALPMSIVATFAVMHLMGFSVDNLSLMALTLAVGFVVDDAIVMLENIVRHVEMGKTPLQAALDGSKEISFTIISMTISLAAVFIPVLFMGGIVGRLFHEFSVVIAAAILLSGFVSLTLTPMLCARFLKPHHERRPGLLMRASENVFDGMQALYRWTLDASLRLHPLTFLVSLAVLWGTVHMFQTMPKGFLPSQDTGQIQGFTEAEQGVSFERMVQHQQALHEVLKGDPAIRTFMSSVGAGGPNVSGNSGRFMIRLKDHDQRNETADEVIRRLRPKLNREPGVQAFLVNPPAINIGGRAAKALYQYTLQSPDTAELYRVAQEMEAVFKTVPQIQDVSSDLQLKNPQARVAIDRDKASALGVSARQIELALQSSYGTREVSTIYAPSNQYKVIMELLPQYRRDMDALSLLYVRTAGGVLARLDTLAQITAGVGPMLVNHTGQLTSVTIAFNARPGVSLGEAVQAVEAAARDVLPATVHASFQGTAQAFQASLKDMGLLLFMAVVVIYLILGVLYESFIHPLTILSGLPSAGFGALLTLWWYGFDLNLYGFVGIIMLIGIVKKNAIMMIDFALEVQREQGLTPREAIRQGCLVRFRPIMMTTMAAIMGAMPIAVGYGAGGDARQPLGLCVVGGLVTSQLLTLYITPVYYIYFDKLQRLLFRTAPRPA